MLFRVKISALCEALPLPLRKSTLIFTRRKKKKRKRSLRQKTENNNIDFSLIFNIAIIQSGGEGKNIEIVFVLKSASKDEHEHYVKISTKRRESEQWEELVSTSGRVFFQTIAQSTRGIKI